MTWGFQPPPSTASDPTTSQVNSAFGHTSTTSWHFSGSDDAVHITDFDDVFAPAGTIAVWIYALSDGGGNNGFIASSLGSALGFQWHIINFDATDFTYKFRFTYHFSTTAGFFDTENFKMEEDTWNLLLITYDRSDVSNIPRLYINNQPWMITVTQTPVGTAQANDTSGIVIGNNATSAGIRNFDGYFNQIGFWQSILSSEERAQVWNNGIPSAWEDIGSGIQAVYEFGDDASDDPTTDPDGLRDQSTNNFHADPKNLLAGNEVTIAP